MFVCHFCFSVCLLLDLHTFCFINFVSISVSVLVNICRTLCLGSPTLSTKKNFEWFIQRDYWVNTEHSLIEGVHTGTIALLDKILYGFAISLAYPSGEEEGVYSSKWFLPSSLRLEGGRVGGSAPCVANRHPALQLVHLSLATEYSMYSKHTVEEKVSRFRTRVTRTLYPYSNVFFRSTTLFLTFYILYR